MPGKKLKYALKKIAMKGKKSKLAKGRMYYCQVKVKKNIVKNK